MLNMYIKATTIWIMVRLTSSSNVGGADLICQEAERLTAGEDQEMLRIHMFSSPACDYASNTLVNLIPVLKDERFWNNSRLNMDLIGHGNMQRGFESREGPAEVTYGVHLLCAQGDLPFGKGTKEEYFNYLDYLNCVSSRPEHNLLPLDSCAESAGMENKISSCTFNNAQMAWSNLEASYKRTNDRDISLSPTLEIEWPSTMDPRTPSRVCVERTKDNLEAVICSAILLSRAADIPTNNEALAQARTLIDLMDNNCDYAGDTWGAVDDVCDGSIVNPFTASMMYALPVIILIVVVASVASCLRARFLIGYRRDSASMNHFIGAFQLARLDRDDIEDQDNNDRGINPLLLSALPTTTPAGLATQYDNHGLEAHCTICLDDVAPSEPIYELKCSHVFHRACLKGWIVKKNECPVCRKQVYSSED